MVALSRSRDNCSLDRQDPNCLVEADSSFCNRCSLAYCRMNPTRNPAINNTNQRTSLCRIDVSLHFPSLHASKQRHQPTHKLPGQYSTHGDSLSRDRLEL